MRGTRAQTRPGRVRALKKVPTGAPTTTGGLDSVRAVHARSDGSRHAPFTPACGTGTEASRTNDLHPALAQACTRRAPAAALLRKPVTSLTTTDRLGKSHPMKASISCANGARPAKVSSARWAVSGGRAGKVHALHRGFGLKYAARVFDSGGAHRIAPIRYEAATPELVHRCVASVATPAASDRHSSSIAEGPGRGRVTKIGV